MIGLTMSGRLGNQFFRYAFARMLMYKRNDRDKLLIDFSCVDKVDDDSFENVLKYFQVQNYEEKKHILSQYASFKQLLAVCWYYRFRPKINKFFLRKRYNRYEDEYCNYSRLRNYGVFYELLPITRTPITNIKNIFVNGMFENPCYSYEIRDILLKEFTPRYPIMSHNTELYKIINNKHSVCISIRRGDYVSTNAKARFYLCNEEYFSKAINLMRKMVPDCVFIFFSDDIEWVKMNIKIDGEVYYERGDDPIWEKLRLMYSCKHFIISNSTFSWWAQFLCRNRNKIVVSPSRWFKHINYESPLILNEFIKIPV